MCWELHFPGGKILCELDADMTFDLILACVSLIFCCSASPNVTGPISCFDISLPEDDVDSDNERNGEVTFVL